MKLGNLQGGFWMERTLYLDETENILITRDGPSLWIKKKGLANARIPQNLVDRVVIIGNVRIDAGVITLFTEKGIPVTLFNSKGEETAVAIPYNHHLANHHEEQKLLLLSDKGVKGFRCWIHSKTKNFQLETTKRLLKKKAFILEDEGFRFKDYWKLIESYLPNNRKKWNNVRKIISNLFKEMIISSLLNAELDPHIGVINRRVNFGLALDFCSIFSSQIDLHAILFFKSSPEKDFWSTIGKDTILNKLGIKDIIHRFENRKKFIHDSIEKLIDDLFELIRELRS